MNEPLRQRKPPLSDEKYLARIRELPCCVCGRSGPSDAAHIRMSGGAWGYPNKSYTGGAQKPDDNWAVPLCRPVYKPDPIARLVKPDKPLKLVNVGCHGRQHGMDQGVIRDVLEMAGTERVRLEEAFWLLTGKNPFQIASVLYEKFGTGLMVRGKRRKRPKADSPPKPKRAPGPKQKIASRPLPKGRKFPTKRKP